MTKVVVQSATALPSSPEDDRKKRIRKYTITMTCRTLCLVGVVVDPNWTRFVFAVGAVFLPYLAVIFANVGSRGATDPISPGSAMPPAITSSAAVPPAIEAAPR